MKRLTYTFRYIVAETDMDGKITEREVLVEKSVPDNENGRALAEKEAWNGVIEEYDDGVPEPETPAGDDDAYADMAAAIREGVNGI